MEQEIQGPKKNSVSPFKCNEETPNNCKVTNEKQPNKATWKSLIYNFACSSTAHGIARIAAAETYFKRGVWIAVCLAVYSVLFWFCSNLVMMYKKKPVITKVEVSFEETANFPSVTICNLNMLKRHNLKKMKKIGDFMERFSSFSTPSEGRHNPENNFNASEELEKTMKIMESKAKTKSQRKFISGYEVDQDEIQKRFLHKLLKKTPSHLLSRYGHTLDEMLMRCRWSRWRCDRKNLRKLWKHFWHWRYGNCYTFNSGTSETGEIQEVLTIDDPGPNNGLQMDIFVNQLEYTSNTEEAGIRVSINDQGIMPFPDEQGFSVPTGFSTTIGLRKLQLTRVDPFHNNSCYNTNNESVENDNKVNETDTDFGNSENIYKNRYHVGYSVQACRKSCYAQLQQKFCNCSEAKFPLNSSDCSTAEQGICIGQVFRKYMAKGEYCAQKCPLPCKDNSFRYSVSSSQWSTTHQKKMRMKYRSSKGSLSLRENVLRLNIFYEDFSVEKVIDQEGYTIENLLADIGGQLGLWVGISVLTVTEVLELVSSLLFLALKHVYDPAHNK